MVLGKQEVVCLVARDHHEPDQLGLLHRPLCVGRPLPTRRLKRGTVACVQIEAGDGMSRLYKPNSHGQTHSAETNKSDPHTVNSYKTSCGATYEHRFTLLYFVIS